VLSRLSLPLSLRVDVVAFAAHRVVHWPTAIVGYFIFHFFVGNFAVLGFLSLQSTPAMLVTELIV
jgi:hypothetical protein